MNTTLGERIKARMKELKLTQESLAQMVGITQPGVFKLTSGKQPTTTKILELAQALRVTPEWLLTGEDGKLPATKPESNTEHEPPRPPVIEEGDWRELPVKTRALIEDILIKSSHGDLKEPHIKAVQNLIDVLTLKE